MNKSVKDGMAYTANCVETAQSSLFKRVSLGCFILVALASLTKVQAQKVHYNQDVRLNRAGAANDYEITVRGNRLFSDFAFGFPGPSAGETTTYNSISDTTTLKFFGGTILQGTTIHLGYSLTPGINNGHGFGPPDALAQGFTFNGTTVETHISGVTLGLAPTGPDTGTHGYLVAFAKVGLIEDPADSLNEWFAIPIYKDQSAMLELQNAGVQDVQVLEYSAKFFEDITLGDLTMTGTPPDTLDRLISTPVTINAGNKYTMSIPEPSGTTLAGIGMIGLAGLLKLRLWRRK